MIPRLSICFALSVLLHGLLLLSAGPTFRSNAKGHGLRGNDASGKLVVFLEAESDRTKPSEVLSPAKIASKPVVVTPIAQQPGATQPPTDSPAPMPLPGWLVQPPPDVVNQQAHYRQLYEMQARQQAMQQAYLYISHLQADIEQSLNQHGEPVSGQCTWPGDSTKFECSPVELQQRMQPEADRLSALRAAMKNQGSILDGFTVESGGSRVAINFRVHSASNGHAP